MPDLDPALALVASMVLDNGSRWGDAATPEQWDDMQALLTRGGARRHFWLRARGRSKTFDAGAGTLGFMLTGRAGPGDEMYAAAASKDQAGLLANKIQAIARNTPELAGAVEVQQHRVITPSTGAELQVLSSELPGSWGKTPLWLFGDEICNHDNTAVKEEFLISLLTSLIKRSDSVCLLGSTPSAETHWSYAVWQRALASGLWRPSIVAGPAPWQDPAELEEERQSLPEHQWRRLFLCEWAAADDALADESALTECTREGGAVPPEPGCEYVVTWDIGWKKDHSAVVVAHTAAQAGRKIVIIDRLESWVPQAGRDVRISEVLAFAAEMSRDYGGAPLYGDPHEAWQTIQDMKAAGYNIRPADVTAGANSTRAKMMLRLVRDRTISLPDDAVLRREFLSLRLTEGTTPGIVRLSSDGSAKGHFDRVTAIMYAAGELLMRPGWSWRNYTADNRECGNCHAWYMARLPACSFCRAPNPDAADAQPGQIPAPVPYIPQPGGFEAALLGPGARKCGRGHVYNGTVHGDYCPVCARGNGSGSMQMPAAFSRALTIGRR